MVVQRGERLVEQQCAGIRGERAREGDALLLAAGELMRVQTRLRGEAVRGKQRRGLFGAEFAVAHVHQARFDVLCRGHGRKQRVVLKQIPDAAPLRRQVDAAPGIEQHRAVELDMPAVRPDDAGNAAQRQALAGAGRAEQAQHAAVCRERDVQRKVPVALGKLDRQRHSSPPAERLSSLYFVSRRFTATSTANEMARLISTQR